MLSNRGGPSRTAALLNIRLAGRTDRGLWKTLCRGICKIVNADEKDRNDPSR